MSLRVFERPDRVHGGFPEGRGEELPPPPRWVSIRTAPPGLDVAQGMEPADPDQNWEKNFQTSRGAQVLLPSSEVCPSVGAAIWAPSKVMYFTGYPLEQFGKS